MYRKDCCTAPAAAATVAEEKMVARVALAVVAMVTEKRTATAAKAAGTCVNLFRLSSAVPPPFTPSARSRQTDHGGKVWAFDPKRIAFGGSLCGFSLERGDVARPKFTF